jgi:transposase
MDTSLHKIRARAAGIDLGSESIFVAIEGQPVRQFETVTAALVEAVAFLKGHAVESVAMEATGIYWIPLYELLEQADIEVYLVNGAHVKNVPGRKSDVQDCQWIQQLHSYGLLRAGFVPDEDVRVLRSYLRLRRDHIEMAAAHVLHMQKALELMNVKLHKVISQITGVSGLRVVEAILSGARDPERLADLCDMQILKSKRERVVRALEGNYRREHLFALGQALEAWRFYQQQIEHCDQQIEAWLAEAVEALPNPPPPEGRPPSGKPKPVRHHAPKVEDLHGRLMCLTQGKDPTVLPCITDLTLLQLVAETGLDMSRWKTAKHFTSWLGLAPTTDQSGSRRRKRRTRHKNEAGQIFRECARALARSKHLALGGFYRRVRARSGARVANVAAARKLAVLYYNMLRYGLDYVETGLAAYEHREHERMLRRLTQQAETLGLSVVPAEVAS